MKGRTKGGDSGLPTCKVGSVTLLEQECSVVGKLDRRPKVVTAVEPTVGEGLQFLPPRVPPNRDKLVETPGPGDAGRWI